MNCHHIHSYLEDYCDDLLSEEQASRIRHHIENCLSCSHVIDAHHQYLKKLQICKQYTVTDNSKLVDFISTKQRFRFPALKVAMIAAMLLLILFPFYNNELSTLTAYNSETSNRQTVDVIINAPKDMKNATLTIALPEGTLLEGYETNEQITWSVDLKSGDNLLKIPIHIKESKQTILNVEITMRYKNRTKSFQLTIVDTYLNDSTQGAIDTTAPRSSGV